MTATDICNKALAHLGESRITDFNENSVLGEKCRTHFAIERDALLRMHRWNFAKERAELTKLADAPAFGYKFYYELPADCIRVRTVNGVDAAEIDGPWEIEGRKMACDADSAKITYTKRIEDESLFDAIFILALAAKLAAALCLEVTNSQEKKNAILQEFAAMKEEAAWADAVEARVKVTPATSGSRTIAARVGSAGDGRQSY